MSQSFQYATKVWLSTVIISPVTILGYDHIFGSAQTNLESNLGFIGLAMFFSVILSSPVWWLMVLSAKKVNKMELSHINKKMVMVLICLLLPLILFVILLFSTDTLDSGNTLLSFPIFYICINTVAAIVVPLKPEPSPLTYS